MFYSFRTQDEMARLRLSRRLGRRFLLVLLLQDSNLLYPVGRLRALFLLNFVEPCPSRSVTPSSVLAFLQILTVITLVYRCPLLWIRKNFFPIRIRVVVILNSGSGMPMTLRGPARSGSHLDICVAIENFLSNRQGILRSITFYSFQSLIKSKDW